MQARCVRHPKTKHQRTSGHPNSLPRAPMLTVRVAHSLVAAFKSDLNRGLLAAASWLVVLAT